MELSEDGRRNRAAWDARSDEYQAQHAAQLEAEPCAWGTWSIPESEIQALGDVANKDVLELGCGAAQWSIGLLGRGARPVGLDNSARQLEHARRAMAAAGVEFPLVHASADHVPLPDTSFDIVFCDHGAMSWADPYQTVPEVARLLRPNGLLVFNVTTPVLIVASDPDADYFRLGRSESPEGSIEFQLGYGAWIRLLHRHGFLIEDLIELRPSPNATTTYDLAPLEWARRWPAEHIWKARKL
jgi:SAM-dependent methyltransferase